MQNNDPVRASSFALDESAPVLVGNSKPETAVMESTTFTPALGQAQIKVPNSGRLLVRVTSRRTRLLDEDNLSAKWVCDCLRYAGIIQDDTPSQVKIEVGQQKISGKAGEKESVIIEIFALTS